MAQRVDTFGVYVRDRLEEWGREFALHRDCEYLGHRSKDMLQVLIEHRGEMPPRVTGFKPIEIGERQLEMERIVTDIARDSVALACCLRGYYCGRGRRKSERYESAMELLERAGERRVSVRQYLTLHDLGFQRVRGRLEGLAAAA